MKRIYILTLVALLGFPNCKEKKEKEFNDPDWRKESMDIAQDICNKLASCVKNDFSTLKKGIQTYAQGELKPERCAEKNKKSKVYLLKGNDPNLIKEIARDCYSQIKKFTCEEITNGSINKSEACRKMKDIQQGSY